MRYIKYGHYVIYNTSLKGLKQEAYNTKTGTLYKYDFTHSYKYHADCVTKVPAGLILTLLIIGEITVHERKLLNFTVISSGKDITESVLDYFQDTPILERRDGGESSFFPTMYTDPEVDVDRAGPGNDYSSSSLDEFFTAVGYYGIVYGVEPRLNVLSRSPYVYAAEDYFLDKTYIKPREPLRADDKRNHKIKYGNAFLVSGLIEALDKSEKVFYRRALDEIISSTECNLIPFNQDTLKVEYSIKGANHSLIVTDGKNSVRYSCRVVSLTELQLHAVAWAELKLQDSSIVVPELDAPVTTVLKDPVVLELLNYLANDTETYFKPYRSKLSIRKEVINEFTSS